MSQSCISLDKGQFKVDQSGQATYRLPIEVPAGPAGQKPVIEISYDHRRENGIMGVGWYVTGLSVIARTKATIATDGYNGVISYTNSDRLALDGQRLICVNGEYWGDAATYYTEVHSSRSIIGGATPQSSFSVCTKTGEIWTYGGTADSLIYAGTTNVVRVWALSSIEDLNGNQIRCSYTTTPVQGASNTGAYYLSTISYTFRSESPELDAQRFIHFNYGTSVRPDPITTYVAGQPIQTNYILQSISTTLLPQTGLPEQQISSYTFAYSQSQTSNESLLGTITRVGADNTSFTAAAVNWSPNSTCQFDTSQASSTIPDTHNPFKTLHMDINGDGISELVQILRDRRKPVLLAGIVGHTINWEGQISFSPQGVSELDEYEENASFIPVDVNGDGRCDLIVAYPSRQETLAFDIYISNGSSLAYANTCTTSHRWTDSMSQSFHGLDVNGDGRTDLVRAYQDQFNNNNLSFNVFISDFAGSTSGSTGNLSEISNPIRTNCQFQPFTPQNCSNIWSIDLNGDGMVDLVYGLTQGNTLSLTSFMNTATSSEFTPLVQGTTVSVTTPNNPWEILPVDLNRDGMFDLVLVSSDQQSQTTFQPLISNAAGSFVQGQASQVSHPVQIGRGLIFSANGLGEAYILGVANNPENQVPEIRVFSAQPNGAISWVSTTSTGQQTSPQQVLVGDLTGNGRTDLIFISEEQQGFSITPFPAEGDNHNVVESIRNAQGGRIEISYAPLTNSEVYTSSTEYSHPKTRALRFPDHLAPARYPVQEILGQAIYVVSSYTLQGEAQPEINIPPYSYRFGMRYKDARIDLSGRGWEGFHEVTTIDYSAGLQAKRTYLQDFPYTGLITSTTLEAGGAVLKQTINTYVSRPVITDPRELVREVLATSEVCYSFYEGKYDYSVARTLHYDDYGNCNKDIWHGYIQRIDPLTLKTPGAPTFTPLNPLEEVYRYRKYQNTILTNGWALGYLTYDKLSSNATDTDITTFLSGDISLEARTYYPDSFNLETTSAWDNVNSCFLTTSLTYDDYGNIKTEQAASGLVTTWTYETDYHTYPWTKSVPTSITPVVLTTYYGYDPRFGAEIARQDPNSSIFISELDGFGRIIKKQGPVPANVQPNGNSVSPLVTGDTPAKFTQAQVIDLENVSYAFKDWGTCLSRQIIMTTAFGGDIVNTMQFFDSLSRQVGQVSEDKYQVVTEYATIDKPAWKSFPTLPQPQSSVRYGVCYSYDPLGRLVSSTASCEADGSCTVTTTWQYGPSQTLIQTEGTGTSQQYSRSFKRHFYNGEEKTVEVVILSNNNATTTFDYLPNGSLRSTTDPDGIINTISRDSLGRIQNINNPDQNTTGSGQALTYVYDSETGALKHITDASGATRSFTFDGIGRMLGQSLPDGRTIAFTYDAPGNGMGLLSTATVSVSSSPQSSRTYQYDQYCNIINEVFTVNGSSYTVTSVMDQGGKVVQRTLPDNTTVSREYTRGYLSLLTFQSGENELLSIQYSEHLPGGRWQKLSANSQGNPLDIDYTYGPTGLLQTEAVNNGSIMNLTYQYDHLSQLTAVSDSQAPANMGISYSYLNKRLVGATVPRVDTSPMTFAYDQAGNLLSRDDLTYTYNAHFPSSITSSSGTEIYSATPDQCGRTSTRTVNGTALTFQYDGFGKLSSVKNSGQTVLLSNITDHRGANIIETKADGTQTILVCPEYHIRTKDSVTSILKYAIDPVGAVGEIETSGGNTTTLLFRRDIKGSITHSFKNGAIDSIVDYAPYGKFVVRSGNADFSPKFEGDPWNQDCGFYNFGARYYDPMTTRFLTPDSELGGSDPLQADVWNRYAFELNNPITFIDPSGHDVWDVLGGVFGGLEVIGGIAVCVLSEGTLAPTVGAALISAGAGAIVSSATGEANITDKEFWIDQAVNGAVGAALGLALPAASTAIAARTVVGAARLALTVGAESAISGGVSVAGQMVSNGLKGNKWNDGLTSAMVFGAGFGALGALMPRGLPRSLKRWGWTLRAGQRQGQAEAAEMITQRSESLLGGGEYAEGTTIVPAGGRVFMSDLTSTGALPGRLSEEAMVRIFDDKVSVFISVLSSMGQELAEYKHPELIRWRSIFGNT